MGVPSSSAMFWYLDLNPVMTALSSYDGELGALALVAMEKRPIQRGGDVAADEFVCL
jgi:hypothetical protein